QRLAVSGRPSPMSWTWCCRRFWPAITSQVGRWPAWDTAVCWRNKLLHPCDPYPPSGLREFLNRASSSGTPGLFSLPTDAARLQFPFQLRQGLKLNGVYAQPLGRFHVRGYVVGVETLLRTASAEFQRRLKNLAPGLHGVHLVRQNPLVEVAQHGVVLADHLEMDGVGVGEQQQPVAGRQTFQHGFGDKRIGEDAAPQLAETGVVYVEGENPGELRDEIRRLDQTGCETLHQIGGRDAPANLRRVIRAEALQRLKPALEIKINEHSAEVENDGLVHGASSKITDREPLAHPPRLQVRYDGLRLPRPEERLPHMAQT